MTYEQMIASGRISVVRKLLILPSGRTEWFDASDWVVSWPSWTEELDKEKLFHINPPKITIQLKNEGQKFAEPSVPDSIFHGCPSRIGSWVKIQVGHGGDAPEDVFRGKVSRNIALSSEGILSLPAVGIGEELKSLTVDNIGNYRHLIDMEEIDISGQSSYTYNRDAEGRDLLLFSGWPSQDAFDVTYFSFKSITKRCEFKKEPYYLFDLNALGVSQVVFSNPSSGSTHTVKLFKFRSKNRVNNLDRFYTKVEFPAFLDQINGRPATRFGICIPDEEIPDPYEPANSDDEQTMYQLPFPCDSVIVYEHSFVGSEVDWELALTYADIFGEMTEIKLSDFTEASQTNDLTITPVDYRINKNNAPHSASFDWHSRAWTIVTKPFQALKWKVNPKMEGGKPVKPVLPYIDMYCGASYGKSASGVLAEIHTALIARTPFNSVLHLDLETDLLFMLDLEKTKNMADMLEQVAEITNSFIWFDSSGNLNAVSRATLGDYSGDIIGASDISRSANIIKMEEYTEDVENIINQVRINIYGGKEISDKSASSVDIYGLHEHKADYFFMTKNPAATMIASILAWASSPQYHLPVKIICKAGLKLLSLLDLYSRDRQHATYCAHGERMIVTKHAVNLKDFTSTINLKKISGFRLLNDLVMRREEK